MVEIVCIVLLLVLTSVDGQITSTLSTTEPVTLLPNSLPPAPVIPRKLDRFSANHLRSEEVEIISETTILIPQFEFDGNVPNAYFVVGNKTPSTLENGLKLAYNNDNNPLDSFSGQNLNLTLPDNLTTSGIDWLAIWSETENTPVDFIWTRGQTLRSRYPPDVNGFSGEKVKSGPIVLVTRNRLYIANLRFFGIIDAAFVCLHKINADSFTKIEKNFFEKNNGQNVDLELTSELGTDKIDSIGICAEDMAVLANVSIADVKNIIPREVAPSTDVDQIIRAPKCCPLDSVLTEDGCTKAFVTEFTPNFNVFNHNSTHMDNVSVNLSEIEIAPYFRSLNCPKYPLDSKEETFGLLRNGSLIVNGKNVKKILSADEFCIDFIGEVADYEMAIMVCAPEERINKGMFTAYLFLISISTIFLLVAIFAYNFRYKHADVQKKSFTFYAGALCVTFICQLIVQIFYIENYVGCVVIGFLFQISMITSFTWLAILSADIFLQFKNLYRIGGEDKKAGLKRFHWYIITVSAVALLSFIISLSRNCVPDVPNSFFKPQFKRNACYFEEQSQRVFLFYTPIALSILISIGFLGVSQYYKSKNNNNKSQDYYWMTNKHGLIYLLKQAFIMWVVMGLIFISNVFMTAFDTTSGIYNAMNLIEALQGVIVVLLFFLNHAREVLRRRMLERQDRENRECIELINEPSANERILHNDLTN